jgi:hypothetical protein
LSSGIRDPHPHRGNRLTAGPCAYWRDVREAGAYKPGERFNVKAVQVYQQSIPTVRRCSAFSFTIGIGP